MRTLDRRRWLTAAAAGGLLSTCPARWLRAAMLVEDGWEAAAAVLAGAVASGQVRAAALFIHSGSQQFSRGFGEASSPTASFLLGSISKPIAITALMTLYDQGFFDLDEPAQRHLPEFRGEMCEKVTIRHLLTHTAGLPDQLPNNAELRSRHATLDQFIAGALQLPLSFEPGSGYEYSSMGILLAAEIAQRLSGKDIKQFVQQAVLEPLEMRDSALGMGTLEPTQLVQCQVEFGAVESGGGAADAHHWNWNSQFWRQLGAPWGGQHASANDVGKFLHDFLHPSGKVLKPETARLMTRNHNPADIESRGLGLDVGMQQHCGPCSDATFGHTGSTGTIAWADPERDLLCVVLTSLPARATSGEARHPRQLAAECIAGE
jgi:CubicO group peptidase (beta-lactamase class C family)